MSQKPIDNLDSLIWIIETDFDTHDCTEAQLHTALTLQHYLIALIKRNFLREFDLDKFPNCTKEQYLASMRESADQLEDRISQALLEAESSLKSNILDIPVVLRGSPPIE